MAASITPDPFVPSGHYRVRSPSQICRDFGERNSQGVPSKGEGLHCASSNWDSLELNWRSILQAPSHCQKSSRSLRSQIKAGSGCQDRESRSPEPVKQCALAGSRSNARRL